MTRIINKFALILLGCFFLLFTPISSFAADVTQVAFETHVIAAKNAFYSDKHDSTNKTAIVLPFKEYHENINILEITSVIKSALRPIKNYILTHEGYLESTTTTLAMIDSVCVTEFCGKGMKEGLIMAKGQIKGKGITTSDSLTKVILGLVKSALPFAGLLAFIGIIYGGFLYITSFAEDQTEKAKNVIMWSALGLILIFLAYPIVSTVMNWS